MTWTLHGLLHSIQFVCRAEIASSALSAINIDTDKFSSVAYLEVYNQVFIISIRLHSRGFKTQRLTSSTNFAAADYARLHNQFTKYMGPNMDFGKIKKTDRSLD